MTAFLPLCLLALALSAGASPVPAPDPTPPPYGGTSAIGEESPSDCTTVITHTRSGFRGEWTPAIAQTVYTATETVYERVPCDGCALSITTEYPAPIGGIGPIEVVTGTVTAEEPFRTTFTVCSPSAPPLLHIPQNGQAKKELRQAEASSSSDVLPPSPTAPCTHTRLVQASYIALGEQTKTVYTTTATTTSHIDCGGCNLLEVSTLDFMNPGPVIHFTTTETAEAPKTMTEFVCLKTPSIVIVSTLRTLPVQPSASIAGFQPRGEPTTTPQLTRTHPHPSTSTRAPDVTVCVTITRTIYTATVTAVQTAACGPVDADGPPGAIPRQESEEGHFDADNVQRTRTTYSTVDITAKGTWTHRSFHCSSKPTEVISWPYQRPHPTSISGGVFGVLEPQQQQQQQQQIQEQAVDAAAATQPPSHKPSPANPTESSSTFIFPKER